MRHRHPRMLIAAVALFAVLATSLLAGLGVRGALAASNRPQEYLALGDSVAFGTSPLLDPRNASTFIGFPTPAAAALKESLTNAACPGETSSHFISLTGSDNVCGFYRHNFPLHVAYTTSQLDFADYFLQTHPQTLTVSFIMGANDLFVLENSCGGASTPAEIQCLLNGLPAMLSRLSANLDMIYGHFRNLDHYHHQIVAVTYYSLNYAEPLGTSIIARVNSVVADRTLAWDGIVADGFGAFNNATSGFGGDSCAAGLLIVTNPSPLTCNIHPSYSGDGSGLSPVPSGRDLLAQAVVNALRAN
jgi:hypothetical protein